jgi:hypothetical protein
MNRAIIVGLVLCGLSAPAFAWGGKGHEVVAYIAYQNLDDPTRHQVDDLVALNPCFKEWQSAVASLAAKDQPAALFMLAATWPDKIKASKFLPPYDCQPEHKFIVDGGVPPGGSAISANVPPNSQEASQNIGYGDTRRHQYWHFVDLPFSDDRTALDPTPVPNALTEIMLLTKALNSDEGDDLKSYDMVWIEHLVGDVHQPLHDVSRFTSKHPHGDQGANLVLICETTNCSEELHGFWDDLPGPGNDLQPAIDLGNNLIQNMPAPDDTAIDVENPSAWINDGFQKAQSVAYAAPVTPDSAGSSPHKLDTAYRNNARDLMRSQLFLAGHRLAALLKNYME